MADNRDYDDCYIVPLYNSGVTPIQKLADKASRALQELITALPRDESGSREALTLLEDWRKNTIEYFHEANR